MSWRKQFAVHPSPNLQQFYEDIPLSSTITIFKIFWCRSPSHLSWLYIVHGLLAITTLTLRSWAEGSRLRAQKWATICWWLLPRANAVELQRTLAMPGRFKKAWLQYLPRSGNLQRFCSCMYTGNICNWLIVPVVYIYIKYTCICIIYTYCNQSNYMYLWHLV